MRGYAAFVFKYPTGSRIPEGAVYLSTVTQTTDIRYDDDGQPIEVPCFYVWHYFLVKDGD